MGIGVFGTGSKKTSKKTVNTTTTLGGQAQAQDATVLTSLQLGEGASVQVLDQGAVKRAFAFGDAQAARAAAAHELSVSSFRDITADSLGKSFSSFKDSLSMVREAFGGAVDAQAAATERVAAAYAGSARLEGAVDAEGLVKYVLIGLGLLGAGALFVFARKG